MSERKKSSSSSPSLSPSKSRKEPSASSSSSSSPTKSRRESSTSSSSPSTSSSSPTKSRRKDEPSSTSSPSLSSSSSSPSKSRSSKESSSRTASKDKDTDKWLELELAKAKEQQAKSSKSSSKDRDGDREKDRERTKDRDRDKEKERERDREKTRDRDKDSERERRKDRDETKERDRNRERDRDRDKERDKERSKDKERRDKEKDKEKETKPKSKTESKKQETSEEEDAYEEDFEEYEEDFEADEDEDEKEKQKQKEEERKREREKEERRKEKERKRREKEKAEEVVEEEELETVKSQPSVSTNVVVTNEPERSVSPTLLAVRAAIDAENTRTNRKLGSSTSNSSGSLLGARKVMDVRTSKAQQEAIRRITRYRELSKIITLESVTVDLLDMAPLDEYGMYIRHFGQSGTSQQSSQTHDVDDQCDKDVQTNPAQLRNRGVQVPGEGEADEEPKQFESVQPLDTLRLERFLTGAVTVVESLLNENVGEILLNRFSFGSDSEWSTSYIKLNNSLLENRVAEQVIFSQFLPHHAVVVYSIKSTSPSRDPLGKLGVICVWNLDTPDEPSFVLVTPLTPSVACMPSRNTVAAGTREGSVLVWDLRESHAMHASADTNKENGAPANNNNFPLRYPTYSTDAVKEAHQFPIEQIQRIGLSQSKTHHSSSASTPTPTTHATVLDGASSIEEAGDPLDLLPIFTDEDGGSAFKIASLDDSGILNVWVVVELADQSTSSDMDLHVSIGGRLRVVHTATLNGNENFATPTPTTPHAAASSISAIAMRAFDFTLHPLDPSRVLIAGDQGKLVHGARLGGTRLGTLPRAYQVKPFPMDVVVVAAHPSSSSSSFSSSSPSSSSLSLEGLVLVGCTDGSVALFHVERSQPILGWDLKSRCTGIAWSTTRAGVFFVTTRAALFIFDLFKSLMAPIVTYDNEGWQKENGKGKTNATNSANSASGKGRCATEGKMLALLREGDAAVEIHLLTEKYSVSMKELETEKLASALLKNSSAL